MSTPASTITRQALPAMISMRPLVGFGKATGGVDGAYPLRTVQKIANSTPERTVASICVALFGL